MKSKFFLLASMMLLSMLLTWHIFAIVIGQKDDKAASWLEQRGAYVTRSPSFSPLTLFGMIPDNKGRVLSVMFQGQLIDDAIVNSILDLSECEIIYLSNCTFSRPDILVNLASMENLVSLHLHHKSATDDLINMSAKGMGRLIYLYIQDTDVSDKSVLAIASLPRLKHACIYNTKFTKNGIINLQAINPKLNLDLDLKPLD